MQLCLRCNKLTFSACALRSTVHRSHSEHSGNSERRQSCASSSGVLQPGRTPAVVKCCNKARCGYMQVAQVLALTGTAGTMRIDQGQSIRFAMGPSDFPNSGHSARVSRRQFALRTSPSRVRRSRAAGDADSGHPAPLLRVRCEHAVRHSQLLPKSFTDNARRI